MQVRNSKLDSFAVEHKKREAVVKKIATTSAAAPRRKLSCLLSATRRLMGCSMAEPFFDHPILSGAPKGEKNGNYKHGRYTEEVAAARRWLREATHMLRKLNQGAG